MILACRATVYLTSRHEPVRRSGTTEPILPCVVLIPCGRHELNNRQIARMMSTLSAVGGSHTSESQYRK